MFQYDLTALYADEAKIESGKSDSQAVGIPMGGNEGGVARGITRINSEGEVAVRCVLLIATDGLFDMMTNDTAVSTAFKHWGNPAAAAAEMIVETGKCVPCYAMLCPVQQYDMLSYDVPCDDTICHYVPRCYTTLNVMI